MRLYDGMIIGPERMIVISRGLTVSECSWEGCGMLMGRMWDAYGKDVGCSWEGCGMLMGRMWDAYGESVGLYGMVEGEVDGVFFVPSCFDDGADVGVHLTDEVGKGVDGGEGVVDGGFVRA